MRTWYVTVTETHTATYAVPAETADAAEDAVAAQLGNDMPWPLTGEGYHTEVDVAD